MKAAVLIVSVVACLVAGPADACSCVLPTGTPPEQVQQAFDEAAAVFVARLKRSALKPDHRNRREVAEDAQFEVVEVFKGALEVGQVVRVYQVLSAGSCGQSSTNDPPWMYAASKAGGEQLPVKFSKEWLIYSSGEPVELGRCTRSSPLNMEGGRDVKILRGLLKRQRR
jgi:hypothetical protein